MSEIKPLQKSTKQIHFEKKREHLTDRELQMEILYSNWLVQDRTERTRSNTSKLVWFVIIGVGISLLSSLAALGLVL